MYTIVDGVTVPHLNTQRQLRDVVKHLNTLYRNYPAPSLSHLYRQATFRLKIRSQNSRATQTHLTKILRVDMLETRTDWRTTQHNLILNDSRSAGQEIHFLRNPQTTVVRSEFLHNKEYNAVWTGRLLNNLLSAFITNSWHLPTTCHIVIFIHIHKYLPATDPILNHYSRVHTHTHTARLTSHLGLGTDYAVSYPFSPENSRWSFGTGHGSFLPYSTVTRIHSKQRHYINIQNQYHVKVCDCLVSVRN